MSLKDAGVLMGSRTPVYQGLRGQRV